MTNLKQQISDYLPILKTKLKKEKDTDKKRFIKIKLTELQTLLNQL